MIELLPFVQAQDSNPPDFIAQMVEAGECRSSCRKYPNSLEPEELQCLQQRSLAYYRKESLKILLELIPLKKPQIPLLDHLSLSEVYEALQSEE
jgi:hypothetical protein